MSAVQPSTDLPQNARVLLVRLSALGDIIFALETLSALKAERPDVVVDFLVGDRFAAILRDHPMIDELIVFPRGNKLRIPGHFLRLRRRRYDVVLDLHGILKSGLQVLLARADRKIGYSAPGSREGAGFAYHLRVQLPSPLPHRAERGGYLLRELGLEATARPPVLPSQPQMADFFPARSTGRTVILHPGTSSFAEFKRWPVDRFAQLAGHLVQRGFTVALSFGPGEEGLITAVQAQVSEVIAIDGRKIGLTGLAEVMRQADVVVAADTGPLHIATAVGTRVVALFGPKDADLYGPRGTGHALLFHDVPCRPCKRRECASPQCVLGIGVDEVLRNVLALAEA